MPRCSRMYCGMRWYLWNASIQSAVESGGTAPTIGSHSVIESPEPVRRVSPPMVTMAAIIRATTTSHQPTVRRWRQSGNESVEAVEVGCIAGLRQDEMRAVY